MSGAILAESHVGYKAEGRAAGGYPRGPKDTNWEGSLSPRISHPRRAKTVAEGGRDRRQGKNGTGGTLLIENGAISTENDTPPSGGTSGQDWNGSGNNNKNSQAPRYAGPAAMETKLTLPFHLVLRASFHAGAVKMRTGGQEGSRCDRIYSTQSRSSC